MEMSSLPKPWARVSILTLRGAAAGSLISSEQVKPLLPSEAGQQNGEFSPDGRWIAYQSPESGRSQVYVRPFPRVNDARYPISTDGGTRPVWARAGNELFYLDGDGRLTSVRYQTTATSFIAGAPARIFDTRYHSGYTRRGDDLRAYDVSPDGQRFLMIKDGSDSGKTSTPASIVMVLNWSEELKTRAPPGK